MIRRVLVAWIVVTATVVLVTSPARADAPRDQGWWTLTNPGGLPAAPPAPPDVPGNGLLIQAGGSAPSAYAAVLYELAGASAGKLTLTVAPNSLTTPSATLQLCQLLQPINHPEQGGPIADAPPYDCGKSVTAGPSADGKSYEFDASGLVTDGLVAVAILPMGPADRVVLNAPDANSLATQPGSSADTGSPAIDSTATSPDSTPISSGDTASGLPATIASPSLSDSLSGASVAGPTGAAPALAGAAPASNGTAGTFVPAASTSPTKATPLLVVLFVIGGLAGVALWLYAGRQRTGTLLSR